MKFLFFASVFSLYLSFEEKTTEKDYKKVFRSLNSENVLVALKMENNESYEINNSNTSEMYKLDSKESFNAISLSTIRNFSFVSLNTSMSGNLTQQSWIQTASRIIPLYSVIFLLAVIGNSLVILTLVQNKRMRTITNLFLLNLAISDLFLGVFCMPFTLVGMLLRDFIFGELMCKLLPYLQG